jgi:hypothetical protein
MELPRRKFLHLAAGAAAVPAVSRRAGAAEVHESNRNLPAHSLHRPNAHRGSYGIFRMSDPWTPLSTVGLARQRGRRQKPPGTGRYSEALLRVPSKCGLKAETDHSLAGEPPSQMPIAAGQALWAPKALIEDLRAP